MAKKITKAATQEIVTHEPEVSVDDKESVYAKLDIEAEKHASGIAIHRLRLQHAELLQSLKRDKDGKLVFTPAQREQQKRLQQELRAARAATRAVQTKPDPVTIRWM